jgi:hypothetical protein
MCTIRQVAVSLVLVAAVVVAAAYGVKPGRYVGKWEGSSSGGTLEMTITGNDGQPTSADIVFTFQDRRVPTKLRRFVVTGQAIEIVYDFEIGSDTLQSSLKGELKDDKLTGTYKTSVSGGSDQVDQGTWEAKRDD